jgi:hypothetical protein
VLEHALPLACFVAQVPALQNELPSQSVSSVHIEAQAVPAALHANGAHEETVGAAQAALVPTQPPAAFSVEPEQVVVHSASGSCPLAMGPHVPSAPAPFFADVQAWQVPLHTLSQHTPSTQKLDAQSALAVQASPFAIRRLS